MSDKVPTVLIADDDLSVVNMLAERCAAIGFKVETAITGIQALMMARRSLPDVLIIDFNLPDVDGLAVCRRLRDSDRKPSVVIVMTGSERPDTIEQCETLGTIYTKKGPDFWNNIARGLAPLFPDMASKLKKLAMTSGQAEVPKRPRVLLIDDDPNIEKFFSSRLAKYGVDTLYAPDGSKGFRIACKERPSVIISEYFLPIGDVHYLLWRLRSTPATKNIPVFVLSGKQLDELTEKHVKLEVAGGPGAAAIFRKSCDMERLFDALQKIFGFQTKRIGSGALSL